MPAGTVPVVLFSRIFLLSQYGSACDFAGHARPLVRVILALSVTCCHFLDYLQNCFLEGLMRLLYDFLF
jgi:hypothetical protein